MLLLMLTCSCVVRLSAVTMMMYLRGIAYIIHLMHRHRARTKHGQQVERSVAAATSKRSLPAQSKTTTSKRALTAEWTAHSASS